MKRCVVLIALLLLAGGAATAQTKIGHINSEAIMQTLPEAIDAQKSLDGFVTQWEGELQKMQAEWKKKFDEYDKRKLILTDQARAEAEKQLRDMDQGIADFRHEEVRPERRALPEAERSDEADPEQDLQGARGDRRRRTATTTSSTGAGRSSCSTRPRSTT